MSAEWTPLAVDFFMDPKVASVSGPAKLLLLASFCHCQSGVTDGRIRSGVLPILKAQTGATDDHVAELVDERLWTHDVGDYLIPSWLKWNDDSATINDRKAAARERARTSRERKAQAARTVQERARTVTPEVHESAEPKTQTPSSSQTPASSSVKTNELVPAPVTHAPPPKGDVEAVFAEWKQATGKTDRVVLDPKRRKVIKQALTLYPLDDVLDAVHGWKHSPHHRGENERGTVYNDLDLLLRDSRHIEQFRDLERDHPSTHAAPKRPKAFGALAALANEADVLVLDSEEVAS